MCFTCVWNERHFFFFFGTTTAVGQGLPLYPLVKWAWLSVSYCCHSRIVSPTYGSTVYSDIYPNINTIFVAQESKQLYLIIINIVILVIRTALNKWTFFRHVFKFYLRLLSIPPQFSRQSCWSTSFADTVSLFPVRRTTKMWIIYTKVLDCDISLV